MVRKKFGKSCETYHIKTVSGKLIWGNSGRFRHYKPLFQQKKRLFRGLQPNRLTSALKLVPIRHTAIMISKGDVDRPDRFFQGTAIWSGNTGNRQSQIATDYPASPLCHGPGNRFTHRTMLFKKPAGNLQQLLFYIIVVGHDPPSEPGGTAGDCSNPFCNQIGRAHV